MGVRLRYCIYFLYSLCFVQCGYPPQGEEVQMGSVLLPATRRGRYLANIVRRQAVDGTGIKFNKDADRMNAEAKKKVDVLSEELLPYIIAEQERRTTLYKRVMTAIQNGEKGVTIGEIRNKPPLIIRKGLMYRCPANRAPKEPDGSGVIMCESDIDPTPIMYDSCLSAEDKELYVADNRYFFCNRHKVEGPDLPRNGTTVIGCAPLERTSLNYTTGKCALEDTDDVVVHYRYYPDKTYKFVTELDPDHEVCDHWNPCQIGYIYSLPSPDQAMPANELWRDYEERPDEYEKDEIVPPIPEDNPDEYVPDNSKDNYKTSPRKIEIPEGFKFHGIGRYSVQNIRTRVTIGDKVLKNYTNIKVKMTPPPASRKTFAELGPPFFVIQLFFTPLTTEDMTNYYCRFESLTQPGVYKYKIIVDIHHASVPIKLQTINLMPGQEVKIIKIPLKCGKCTLRSLMVRARDCGISNLGRSRYRVRTDADRKYLEIELMSLLFSDFGDYFVVLQTEDGNEERIKALSMELPDSSGSDITCERKISSVDTGTHVDNTIKYACSDCTMVDVLCEGKSVINGGRISIVTASKFVSFNFPSFENENSCVYIGIFKTDETTFYKKFVQIIDNASPAVNIERQDVDPPPDGTQFEMEIPYQCQGDCSIDRVTLNGVPLELATRRVSTAGIAFYAYTPTVLSLRITSFSSLYLGIFQATFNTASGMITKTVMEIKDPNEPASADSGTTAAAGEAGADGATTAAGDAASDGSAAAGAEGETTAAAEGGSDAPADGSAAPAEGGETPAGDAPAGAADAPAAEEAATEAPA